MPAPTGWGIPSPGDRSARDTHTYAHLHASDIEEDEHQVHVPTPSAPDLGAVALVRLVGSVYQWVKTHLSGAITVDADGVVSIDSGVATDGHVLTADGAGGAAWEAPSGGAGGATGATLHDLETYQRFVITAHRGDINATDGYPENTLEGCVAAARKGAQRIEVDPRLSSDGEWYLFHDATVDRTTDGSGNVVDKSAAQLDALNIDGGYGYDAGRHAGLYHPPSLAAAIVALTPYDVTLQLDNKAPGSAGALATYVSSLGWAHRVAINAYSQAEAQAIKAVSADIMVVGDAAWAETDIVTPSPGVYNEAQILALAPIQVHTCQTMATDYGITDEAARVRDAYALGARGHSTWDLPAVLEEYREFAFLDGHLATADPHTQYQKESEKGAANGYAGLDATTKVASVQLGSGTASDSTYLRGDQTWATIAMSSGELLMQDGVTAPPVPLETEAQDDWLYEG